MKVILQKNIPGLGDFGEIKEVADGYARNYLLPRKLVISSHTGSNRALIHQKKILENKVAKRKKQIDDLRSRLNTLESLEIQARAGVGGKLFGSVTTAQITKLLEGKGFVIDKRKIELRDKIRSIGQYVVKINLMDGVHLDLGIKVIPDANSKIEKAEPDSSKTDSSNVTSDTEDLSAKDSTAAEENTSKVSSLSDKES